MFKTNGSNVEAAMDEITQAVANEKCILFLGAGAHCPPPEDSFYKYSEEKRPPLGGELSRQLAEACDFSRQFSEESASNLQRVSLCYETRKGRPKLISEIKKAVHEGKEPSPVLHGLADLPFPLVITTNYDQLFETALRKIPKKPEVAIYNKDRFIETTDLIEDPTSENSFLFKIHGDINKIHKDSEYDDSIVVTDEDYINFVLRMSDKGDYYPVPGTISHYLKRWTILFIGYSLMDYNLRLLFKTLFWRMDKRGKGPGKRSGDYSIDPAPDPLIVKILEKRVYFLTEDVWKFVPELYRRIKGKEMPK